MKSNAYAALSATTPLEPFVLERRAVGPHDVLIEIEFCGVCHSDIHQARGEWGNSVFPMVPGHEVVGRIVEKGAKVSQFSLNDAVGVGCFVDSCRSCSSCSKGLEQYCSGHVSFTYNGTEQDKVTPTHGGYSSHIVVDERYVLRVSPDLDRRIHEAHGRMTGARSFANLSDTCRALLEAGLERLRETKAKADPAEYAKALEQLLLELAKVYEAAR